MKILVTGYSRSGTTLVRKLFRAHPHVKRILHETMLLVGNRGKIYSNGLMWGWNGGDPIKLLFDVETSNWGEKILYDHPCLDHGVVDTLDYCLFWNETFLPDARIINIIRYPFDVVMSSANKRKATLERAVEIYKHYMPWMANEIDALPNSLTIKFEDLLLETELTLEKIFYFCALDSSRRAVKETLSRATPDLTFNRINPNVLYKYFGKGGDKEIASALVDSGLEKIAEKLGYHEKR